MVPAGDVDLCVETFGEPTDPAVLLIAGRASAMDWWDDEFCRRLAACGRLVVRYDHRDTGRSTSFPAGAPRYSQVDLAQDALGLLDTLQIGRAHLMGWSLGGALALRMALARPGAVRSMTLMASTLRAPERRPDPTDWSDRRAAVDRLVSGVRANGGLFTADEPQIRRLAERVYDRTGSMAASQANHWLAAGDPPAAAELGAVTAPTAVLHGTDDRVVSCVEAEELARAIPGARIVWLEGIGHEYPPAAVWRPVIEEILRVDSTKTAS